MHNYQCKNKEGYLVFFDKKGSRWQNTKLIVKIFFGLIVAALIFIGPQLTQSKNPFARKRSAGIGSTDYPRSVAYSDDLKDVPIIGEGHMQRVMAVKNVNIQDPYSKRPGRALTEDERKIIGDKKYVIERYGNATGKYVAITFDDGPDPAYTPKILDILAREKIQATFFVTGKSATQHPEIVKRMAREGHMVANHTFSHIDFDNHTSLRAREEIVATDQIIRSLTGKESLYFRLPYNGGVDDEDATKQNVRGILQAQQLGFEVASFTQDSDDWSFDPSKKANVSSLNDNGNIFLLHDGGGNRTQSINYLEELIAKGKNENYKFITMAQLTRMPEKK